MLVRQKGRGKEKGPPWQRLQKNVAIRAENGLSGLSSACVSNVFAIFNYVQLRYYQCMLIQLCLGSVTSTLSMYVNLSKFIQMSSLSVQTNRKESTQKLSSKLSMYVTLYPSCQVFQLKKPQEFETKNGPRPCMRCLCNELAAKSNYFQSNSACYFYPSCRVFQFKRPQGSETKNEITSNRPDPTD